MSLNVSSWAIGRPLPSILISLILDWMSFTKLPITRLPSADIPIISVAVAQFGAGGEFRSPMAIAVIGGLLFSTVLSLIFVPAVFCLMCAISDLPGRLYRGVQARVGTPRAAGDRAPPGAPPEAATAVPREG